MASIRWKAMAGEALGLPEGFTVLSWGAKPGRGRAGWACQPSRAGPGRAGHVESGAMPGQAPCEVGCDWVVAGHAGSGAVLGWVAVQRWAVACRGGLSYDWALTWHGGLGAGPNSRSGSGGRLGRAGVTSMVVRRARLGLRANARNLRFGVRSRLWTGAGC
ncbi:hypothetical protein [Kibdelosporangium philippinense]|uniref:hypothetical protein n=1 Tax=Kibdelosporangium philippinense TaxID=211113 RepID=UPI00361B45E7